MSSVYSQSNKNLSPNNNTIKQIANDLLKMSASNVAISNDSRSNMGSLYQYASGSVSRNSTRLSNGPTRSQQTIASSLDNNLSGVEAAILKSKVPIDLNETEELTIKFAGNNERGN
jgi:hypothetical protein